MDSGAVLSQTNAAVPLSTGPFVLDEAGIAQTETAIATAPTDAHRFRLDRFIHHGSRLVLNLLPGIGTTRQLRVDGLVPGVTYPVRTSSDLERWESAGSIEPGMATHATIVIEATNQHRFYRIGP